MKKGFKGFKNAPKIMWNRPWERTYPNEVALPVVLENCCRMSTISFFSLTVGENMYIAMFQGHHRAKKAFKNAFKRTQNLVELSVG